ncbi:transcription factor YdeB [Bacillus salipaludis]|uniref:CarD family transcriptional regulator n=1 Tax=Bacillus salipaludis TaxID=2547811 RepID=A0A4R5VSB6_9BACI|nr:CarD family transcriptional regulator [Bacillus salipaludis]MDQ6598715.1 CarD family transcriptional regulator [Bacillus salipaludis]TDK60741.1 transcription factor YdeB [Bacillus salipaludis]
MEVVYLFQVGDYIVYPMQGAGVIESIEEKEVLGETHQYYVIKMPISKMQVMIPIGKEKKSRIRLVSDIPTLENVLRIFQHGQTDTNLSMKERYKINSEKLKTGNIKDGAEVVRDLMRINKNKALNSSEKQMLESARKIFISELGLIKGLTENQATDLLNNKVG